MDIIKSYKELCEEIEMWKWRVEAYRAEIKALNELAKVYGPGMVSAIDYTQPSVQNTNQIGFEEYLLRLRQLQSHMYLHVEAIDSMVKAKEKIREKLEGLEGVDKRVVYLRDIEDKSLVDISKELGYSYDYIKEISARNKRTHYDPTDK